MTLVDGQPLAVVPADDRGLLYGDGAFETMRAEDGCVPLLARHLARLAQGCAALDIEAPAASDWTGDLARVLPARGRAVVKLLVTRGSGARGYRAPSGASPRRIVQLHPWPQWPGSVWLEGVRMRTCATRLAIGGPLAGIKHLNRLEQVLARSEWRDAAIAEGLMLDADGAPIGGTMTNLFAVGAGGLRTPLLDRCGVRGIARQLVIEDARARGVRVEEVRMSERELREASELFVCNAVLGVWPVTALDAYRFAVGPQARAAQAALQAAGLAP